MKYIPNEEKFVILNFNECYQKFKYFRLAYIHNKYFTYCITEFDVLPNNFGDLLLDALSGDIFLKIKWNLLN
jgi:hypothetical protein